MRLVGLLCGAAVLSLAAPLVAQERLDIGQDRAGVLQTGDSQLSSGEFFDTYLFDGVAGQSVTIQLSSGDFDPYLLVRGPANFSQDNDDISQSDHNSRLTMRLPVTGRYRISATSYSSGETGRYRLSITNGSAGGPAGATHPEAQGGGELVSGRSFEGQLATGDQTLSSGEFVDRWTISGRRGQSFDVAMRSADIDSYLIVRGPGGLSAENDDDDARGSHDARVRFTLTADGTVTVGATSYARGESGRYTLTVSEASDLTTTAPTRSVPTGTLLTIGVPANGRLQTGDRQLPTGEYVNFYTLSGRRGQQIDLRLTSSDFDPYVQISGPNNFSAFNDDDDAGGKNSRLVVTLPADGAYTVAVTSYQAGESGAYQLSARSAATTTVDASSATVPTGTRQVSIGTSAEGVLQAGDSTLSSGEYVDSYRFTGRRGQRVAIDLTSAAFDAYAMLVSPSGQQIENDDGEDGTNARIETVLREDGDYVARVTSYRPGETGSYRLSIAPSNGSPRMAAVPGGVRVHAVMVGIADYGGSANNLEYTDSDAEKMAETLRREGVLSPDSVMLTNADATVAGVRAAFARVAANAGPDDLFLFFFSGHGSQEASSVSALEPDGRRESIVLRDGEITDADMATMFGTVRARLSMLVLDSCFSGGFARNVVNRPGVMGIFSSEEDLTSVVAEKFNAGGFLAYFMRNGLAGEADDDGDRILTAGELSAFLRRGFAAEVADVDAETIDGQHNYQNLVIDRGGVQVDDVVLRLGPAGATRGTR